MTSNSRQPQPSAAQLSDFLRLVSISRLNQLAKLAENPEYIDHILSSRQFDDFYPDEVAALKRVCPVGGLLNPDPPNRQSALRRVADQILKNHRDKIEVSAVYLWLKRSRPLPHIEQSFKRSLAQNKNNVEGREYPPSPKWLCVSHLYRALARITFENGGAEIYVDALKRVNYPSRSDLIRAKGLIEELRAIHLGLICLYREGADIFLEFDDILGRAQNALSHASGILKTYKAGPRNDKNLHCRLFAIYVNKCVALELGFEAHSVVYEICSWYFPKATGIDVKVIKKWVRNQKGVVSNA